MAVWWTNTSGAPSRVMKPKPFASLNHFTVPFSIAIPFVARSVGRATLRGAVHAGRLELTRKRSTIGLNHQIFYLRSSAGPYTLHVAYYRYLDGSSKNFRPD